MSFLKIFNSGVELASGWIGGAGVEREREREMGVG